MSSLGRHEFIINVAKSFLFPCQCLVHLGLLVHSGVLVDISAVPFTRSSEQDAISFSMSRKESIIKSDVSGFSPGSHGLMLGHHPVVSVSVLCRLFCVHTCIL